MYAINVMIMNLGDIVLSNIKVSDYCRIISRISKSKAIKLLQNIDFTKESGTLQKLYISNNF